MSNEDSLYGGLMQTSTTSESSTLSGLATGPVPGATMSTALPPACSSSDSDNHAVMNDKVQILAGSIYEELERMIAKYDQEVVKNLMPLIVSVLENLDLAYTESQELEVELELLKEDNEQLVTQYEREKQLRKGSEQKLLEMEDGFEGERKDSAMKIESLTSIVKMFELKAKNSLDQITRLEEKESEMKKEYSKLHDRYTDLFKTHIDYMERTKLVLGTDRIDQLQGAGAARHKIPGMSLNQLQRSSGPVSFGYSELENNNTSLTSADFAVQTTPGIDRTQTSLKSELTEPSFQMDNRPAGRKGQDTSISHKGSEPVSSHTVVASPVKSPLDSASKFNSAWVDQSHGDTRMVDLEVEEAEEISGDPSFGPDSPSVARKEAASKSQTKTEKRTGNTLYQELSFQDSEALGDVDEGADITVNDNYYGMGKEVENLISENNELLATKNALNIVKDDLIAKVDELTSEHEILREEIKSLQEVRSRLQSRIQELEDELKKSREELEAVKAAKTEEDEDVPMAQRKRFTRVEMARVLMERNQYKEKFMELQEAVRWTEMLRASRSTEPPVADKKNSRGFLKFFGSLFSGGERMGGDAMGPYVNLKYTGSSPEAAEAVTPTLSSMRARSSAERKSRQTSDVFDGDTISGDKLSTRRANERKEQYKQVRAHVKKDEGRVQAYGWSVPASSTKSGDEEKLEFPVKQQLQVPVPVYCRPLMEKEPGMKIWCAAAVNMSGGRTKDGGDIVGASIFYNKPPQEEEDDETCGNSVSGSKKPKDPVSKLDDELSQGRRLVEEATSSEKELSSYVWICTSTHSISKVSVIDANSPADVLESFHVCSSHLLCIASVPGAKESDYRVDEELNRLVLEESELREADAAKRAAQPGDDQLEDPGIGAVSFVTCAVGSDQVETDGQEDDQQEMTSEPRLTKETSVPLAVKTTKPTETEDTDAVHRRFVLGEQTSAKIRDGISEVSRQNEIAFSEVEKMSSVLPTMWLGSQSGAIYVHSAVSQWKRCIHSIRLKDSVLCIVHVKGRVLAALANGTIAIFHRLPDGQWDLTNYHLLDLGKPHSSIRCMVQVHNNVWCGYRNKVFVINPKMMRVEATFDAHPRKESQVRLMAWTGDGVWVSIRLDSTLRLYHAHTHEHLQDVDIEPYVSKMLGTGKLGFSFVRITSMIVSVNRLWLGTGNGVIVSVPLAGSSTSGQLYEDERADSITAETFIPFCNMAQIQLSFHGHRDAVKFFTSVPGHGGLNLSSNPSAAPTESMLLVSGGEGYIDFRVVDDGSDQDYDSHIMVWQISNFSSKVEDEDKSTSSPTEQVKSDSTKHLLTVDEGSDSTKIMSKSPSFGQRVLKSLSPSFLKKSTSHQQLSKSPVSNSDHSRSPSVSSSVDMGSASEHVSLAREATEIEDLVEPVPENQAPSSYAEWNSNVESMIQHFPEPREDFTQVPHFDRGLN